jgi:hypothetical protein
MWWTNEVENEEVLKKRAAANTVGIIKTISKGNRKVSHRVLCRVAGRYEDNYERKWL